jgi:putative ABC transport system permease protein
MWKIAIKSVWARKFRLFAVSIAVLLGVAFMSGTLVLSATLSKTFDDVFSTAFKGVDAFVRGQEAFDGGLQASASQRPTVSASLVDDVKAVDGVRTARGSIQQYAAIVDKHGKPMGNQGSTFAGIWSSDASTDAFQLAQGSAPVNDDQIVIDYASAKKAGFKPGDRVEVLTGKGPHTFQLSGAARFGSADSPGGATYVLLTEHAAQLYTGEPGRFDGIEVAAKSGVSQEELRNRIAKVLPSGAEVITGKELTKETQNAIKTGLNIFNIILLTFAGIALFVGVLIIYNTFSILVAQRVRESALLRALGASRRQVARIVVAEAFVVGFFSGALGLLAGIGLAKGLEVLLDVLGVELPSSALVIPSSAVIASFVVGILATVVSAWLPARRAGKVAPVAALREVSVDRSGASKIRAVLGTLVLAAGVAAILYGLFADMAKPYILVGAGAAVTFLGMIILAPTLAVPVCRFLGLPLARFAGVPGQLARENAVRNPKRTSSTAVALMVGVGLVGFMVILTSSMKASIDDLMDKSFSGDFVLRASSGGTGFSPDLARSLQDRPEVGAVAGFAFGYAQLEGKVVGIEGTDAAAVPAVVDPDVRDGAFSSLTKGELGVSAKLADDHHWKVGDTLTARFARTGEQTLRIGAIYRSDTFLGNYLVDNTTYERNFEQYQDQFVMVQRAKGVTPSVAQAAVEQVAAPYHVVVQDRTGYKEDISKQIDQLLGIVIALLALAIVIALIGIAITLSLSVYERTHEIGLLRAVGMTRRQARRSVRWEAALIALFGTAMGLVVAVFFGVALVQALKSADFITVLAIPVPVLLIIVVVAATSGVLAALWPARRAARLNVLRAISVE